MVGGSSLHNFGAMMIRTDYTQLGIPNHTTYVELNFAYVNSTFRSSKTRTVLRHLRVQYSTNLAQCHVGTRYSHHVSTPSARVVVPVIE
jgi:hypothetical protein